MSLATRSPFSRMQDLQVFAVGSDAAQITWRNLNPPATLTVAGREIVLSGSAGAVTIEALVPATDYVVRLSDGDRTLEESFATRDDPGPVTARFATISDVHLGLDGFGIGKRIKSGTTPPHPLPCAVAAVREAQAWGAELLLIKGDLTESGWVEEWELARELFAAIDIPVLLTGGNHDGFERAEVEPAEGMEIAGATYAPVQQVDLPGVRILLAETSIRRKGSGSLAQVGDELVAAADTDQPVFIGMHHNLQQFAVPWFWPPGISSRDSNPVLNRLAEANANIFMSSGHTHRNRARSVGPSGDIVFTEVGSTSDHPGVWAGYEVTNTVIRQTVHRIADPAVIDWSEKAAAAVGGVWPRWAQGRLNDRSVDLRITHA